MMVWDILYRLCVAENFLMEEISSPIPATPLAVLFRNGIQTEALSEKDISYDSNGNILALKRTGEDGSTVNDLVYSYDGNRLTSLSDSGVHSQNYTYDADGNMTFDCRTGMSLEWNDLGLVEKVSLDGDDLVNYSYLADGTKVSALDGDGDGLLYLGSLI